VRQGGADLGRLAGDGDRLQRGHPQREPDGSDGDDEEGENVEGDYMASPHECGWSDALKKYRNRLLPPWAVSLQRTHGAPALLAPAGPAAEVRRFVAGRAFG